jgi:hypothetical protein
MNVLNEQFRDMVFLECDETSRTIPLLINKLLDNFSCVAGASRLLRHKKFGDMVRVRATALCIKQDA